jgi:S-adenosylmethionine hydrolase
MKRVIFMLAVWLQASMAALGQSQALVFQSDFGLKDGAVAAMKGVAYGVSGSLNMFDLTHEIPAFNIWEAAYRLNQAAPYWPPGTVFVSVVDPGVGSERRSVVLKTKTGHYFVTPDNGTLTLVASSMGIDEVRQIDETTNRLQHSQASHTFHGRDVYAYTGARLAAGIITFQQVGAVITTGIIQLPYQRPVSENGKIRGTIDILDVQYGNLWTNIDLQTFSQLKANPGDRLNVVIAHEGKTIFHDSMVYGKTFADVPEGKNVAYLNSLLNLSIAINMGSFSGKYRVGSGNDWTIEISR